ncbi:hypothetical protein BGZ49_009502 [Haplosporangium sp. Z 27]|nr:hypothetical protein BGZ49_009502 [Haplosporangium sp. Z 27]
MSAIISFLEFVLRHKTRSNGFKVLLAIAAYYVYKYRSNAIGTRRRPELKQPKGAFPLVGHLPLLATVQFNEIQELFEKQYNELGPVWSISLPGFGRMVQIDIPENVEYVLKTNFSNYGKGQVFLDIVGEFVGEGIFSSDGAKWKFQRQLSSNIFKVKAFHEYTSNVFVVEGQKVVDVLGKVADEGTVIDLQSLFLHFTLDALGGVTFGESFGCLDNIDQVVPFAQAIDDALAICFKRVHNPLWKIQERLTGVDKKAVKIKQVLDNHAQVIIDKRRREGYHSEKKDLLQLFIEAKDEEGNPLSDTLIINIIISFAIAGRDTAAHALAWMFYLLLRDGADKDNMNRLVQEVDDVLGGSDPSYETYKKQKYTEACFYEALRVFPMVPRNLRSCVNDDVLPDGTKIYAGEWVTWSPYVMGRSERIWGPDAKEFKPSRWINTEKPSQSKFNSFHAGPRVCLGQQFATIEALTVIGMILQKFEITLEDPSRVPRYEPSLIFPMEHGLRVRVSRRSGATAL